MSDLKPFLHLIRSPASRLVQRWRSLSLARRAAWRIALLFLVVAAAIQPLVLYAHPTLAVEARYGTDEPDDPWGRPWLDDIWEGGVTRSWSVGPNGVDEGGWGDDVVVFDFGPSYSSSEADTRLLPAIAPAFAAPGLLMLAFLCTPWLRNPRTRLGSDLLRAFATAVCPALLCFGAAYWATRTRRPWTAWESYAGGGGVLSFEEDPWYEQASDWLREDLFAIKVRGFDFALPAWVWLAGAAALVCLALALWLRLGPPESGAGGDPSRQIRNRTSIGAGGKLALVLAAHLCLLAIYLTPVACQLDPRLAVDVGFMQGDSRDPWGCWYQRKYITWNKWVYYSIGPNGRKENGEGDDLFPSQLLPDLGKRSGPLKDLGGRTLPGMDFRPLPLLVAYSRPGLFLLAALFVWYVVVPGLLRTRWPEQRFRCFVATASAPSVVAIGTAVWLTSQPWSHIVMPNWKLLVLPPELAVGGTLLALTLTWAAGSSLAAESATPLQRTAVLHTTDGDEQQQGGDREAHGESHQTSCGRKPRT